MKVTIRDVAKEAGVSPSTVSRVLSNNERISQETKQRVKQAIKKLNFKPNAIARSLANNKTYTLGMILPGEIEGAFDNPFYIQAMQGMSLYAMQHNYYMMYAVAKDKKNEMKCVKDFALNGRVDGIIILKAETHDHTIEFLKEMKFPFVVIGHPEDTDSVLWVDNDNEQAAYQVVKRLIEKGHKHIGFIAARKEWVVSKERFEGYKKALLEYGIDYSEDLVYYGEDFDETTGEEGAKVLSAKEELTAIITTDDFIAVGANKYFSSQGNNEKVIIGFNNTTIGIYQVPPISSVDIQPVKLGWYASKMLINQLEGKKQKNNYCIVETEFVEKKSK